jgi:hypothetical protein
MLEVFLTFATLSGMYFWNRKFSQDSAYERWEESLLQVLCGYHLFFAVIFTRYLLEYGGDAIRYWALAADLSQNPIDWMDYWGHGTHFLQWLHYWPSKVLGLEFWFGNVLYACISWLGIREVFALMRPYIATSGNGVLAASGWLIFFLPNLHFWSAGVGKEAWLVVGMALVLKGFSRLKTGWLPIFAGLLLAFWVRPAFGIVLGAVSLVFVLTGSELGVKTKALVGLLGLMVGSLGIWKLSVMMHLEEISIAAIFRFSESQFDFLAGFRANSQIPMAEFNWLQRLWALLFRPSLWEASGFWKYAAAMENTLGLALAISGFLSLFIVPKPRLNRSLPRFLIVGAVVCLGMCLVYGLTLNNLGIIMRMKSTYMVFCYFFCWGLIALRVKSVFKTKPVS